MQVKIKINRNDIGIFFLLIWFFEPSYFSRFTYFQWFFLIGKVAASVVFVLFILIRKKKWTYKPTNIVIGAILIELIILCVTLVNHGAIYSQVRTFAQIMVLVIIDYYLQTKPNPLRRVLLFIFEILIYANFVCIFAFPDGMYNFDTQRNYYLFGHVNDMIVYFLPAIVLAAVSLQMSRDKLIKRENFRPLLLIFVCAISILYTWSATSVVGLSIMLAVSFINRRKVRLNAAMAILVGILVFVFINVLQIQNGFLSYVVGILGRDITFSSRAAVWDRAMLAISHKPWFGYGRESAEIVAMRLQFQQPHCRYFNAIYRGGIVSGVVLLFTYFFGTRKLDRNNKSHLAKFIVAGIWALMIQSSFESYWTPLFYLTFLFGENIDILTTEFNEQSTARAQA